MVADILAGLFLVVVAVLSFVWFFISWFAPNMASSGPSDEQMKRAYKSMAVSFVVFVLAIAGLRAL